MVERLMERGRGASEVTRDESEEEEEVERRRPRREGAARDNYRLYFIQRSKELCERRS